MHTFTQEQIDANLTTMNNSKLFNFKELIANAIYGAQGFRVSEEASKIITEHIKRTEFALARDEALKARDMGLAGRLARLDRKLELVTRGIIESSADRQLIEHYKGVRAFHAEIVETFKNIK